MLTHPISLRSQRSHLITTLNDATYLPSPLIARIGNHVLNSGMDVTHFNPVLYDTTTPAGRHRFEVLIFKAANAIRGGKIT
jgi:hypothetical protein